VASNNEYKRYFIILQEDDKGFEISPGKLPTGYVKIEVKNSKVRLNAFIQNVKLEDMIEYRLILVASGKKLAVDVGKIIIDSSGRGELSYELESDNVIKSGLNIGDFTVAAVTSGASIPLSGYTGRDKLEWKGKYDIVNRQKPQETPRIDKKIKVEEVAPEILEPPIPSQPVMEPEIPVVEQPVVQPLKPMGMPPKSEAMPKAVPNIEAVPKIVPNIEAVPKAVPNIEAVPKQEPELPVIEHMHDTKMENAMAKCPPIAPLEEPCEIEKEYEDIHQYYCDDYDDDDHYEDHYEDHGHHEHPVSPYYSGSMHSKMKKLFKRLRRYEPFEEERGYNWFKVGDDINMINSVAVPYMGYMMPMGYPFMTEGCTMMIGRKDYILGVKYDDKDDDDDDDDYDRRPVKHLLFGVPAIYSKRNEQYYKSRGFMNFKPHKSRDYGYFIMCLNIRSGMLCHMD